MRVDPGDARRPLARRPFLEVRGLCKRFGATVALDGVGADFIAGEIHCILGENGAGKSTLGKIIGGVHSPDAGTIAIEDREVAIGTVQRAGRFGIALVFQELSLAPDLSVRANLLLGTEPHRHPLARLRRDWERGKVFAVFERLKVDLDPESRVGDLSIANQQMVEVAKALIRNPRMIVLDEPTAMLNEAEKQNLYAVLAALRDEGCTILLITHHIEDVEAVSDRVTIMRDGRVVDSFPVSDDTGPGVISGKLGGVRSQDGPGVGRGTRGAPYLRIDGLRDRAGQPAPLEVSRGEIVGLYGVPGGGAERIVQALSGLRPADDLPLTIDGRRQWITTPVRARRMGIAHLPAGRADNGIFPTRSIRENLNVSSLHRYSRIGFLSRRREAAGSRAQLAASAVKYADLEDDIVRLSGGNQQKLLAARVLSAGSRLLILEDPTAGIDIEAKQVIQRAIRARAAEGVAVILLSGDLRETIELADVLFTWYAGRMVCTYRPPALLDKAAIVADVIGHS